ncbi:DUF6702 family protein [Parapedobacter sp. DT-150]|uniref:DUF6702 family protein n=1 Tax=Parapedobacter sp. DT-150 TaxID=3396162 RepID=UPI003F1DBD13
MISIINAFLLLLHPFYVSITTVDVNEQAQTVEVSCRIFYDDLEAALKAESDSKVDLINPPDRAATDSLLAAYLQKQFKLAVNGKQVPLNYLGYEIEEDVAWCYLEAKAVPSVQRMAIDTRILYDQFPGQSNILHVTAYGKRKSTKLDNPEHRATFEW